MRLIVASVTWPKVQSRWEIVYAADEINSVTSVVATVGVATSHSATWNVLFRFADNRELTATACDKRPST